MLFDHPAYKQHEHVSFVSDADTGLQAIIAIHSTLAGPALGGTRMYPYPSARAALEDVLRLSHGMTLKNIMAGLPIGGGKSVIIGDPETLKTPDLLRAFGRAVNDLQGKYICAEDVGTTVADMAIIRSVTPHVTGLSSGRAASGDPSPFTALGVFCGIRAALQFKLQRTDFTGLRVGVLGLGNVGLKVCEQLAAAGAQLIVADIDAAKIAYAIEHFDATGTSPEALLKTPMDVFCPCALGGVLNRQSVAELRTKIIAGAANNQLASDEIGQQLHDKGILYAPDFVINAGGVINCAAEALNDYDAERCTEQVRAIADTLSTIFAQAQTDNQATSAVALRLAEEKLASLGKQKHGAAPANSLSAAA